MKRSSVAALSLTVLAATFATSPQLASASSRHSAVATTKGWTVTLWVARTSTMAGTSIPATVTVNNRTGRSVEITGCPGTDYEIVLGNSKVPDSPVIPTVLCEGTMSPGIHIFHTKVQTTYQECGSTDTPGCGTPPRMSPLPAGIYLTQTILPGARGFPASVGPLTITLTASAPASSKVVLSPYAPFPKAASTGVGAVLARPTPEQVASVRVSVSRAFAMGLTQTGSLPKGAKVTVRLGLFSDTMQGKPAVLSYAVIFDGVDVPSYGPTPGPGGHELVVIVNARTGKTVEAFSYR